MDTPFVADLAALEEKILRLKINSTTSYHGPRIRRMIRDAVNAAYERGVQEGMHLGRAGLVPVRKAAPIAHLPAPVVRQLPAPAAKDVHPVDQPRKNGRNGDHAKPAPKPKPKSVEPIQVVAKPVPYRLRRRKIVDA